MVEIILILIGVLIGWYLMAKDKKPPSGTGGEKNLLNSIKES
jgi:hypothetical protein